MRGSAAMLMRHHVHPRALHLAKQLDDLQQHRRLVGVVREPQRPVPTVLVEVASSAVVEVRLVMELVDARVDDQHLPQPQGAR